MGEEKGVVKTEKDGKRGNEMTRTRISISFEPPSRGTVRVCFRLFLLFAAFVAPALYCPNATLALPLFRTNQTFADFSRILAILFLPIKSVSS